MFLFILWYSSVEGILVDTLVGSSSSRVVVAEDSLAFWGGC